MLTEAKIKALPQPDRDVLVPCGNRDGLYLRVRAATGRKTFVLRRRTNGTWRVETLGDWPRLTLLNARRRAGTTGPATGSGETFGEAAQTFCDEVIVVRYRTAAKDACAYLVRDCKTLAKRPLNRIRRADVAAVVTAKAATGSRGAAVKLLSMLKQFFKWALLHELIDANPASGLKPRDLYLPAYVPRERVLTDGELRALWAMPEEPYGRLLRFVALTACRVGEAQGLAPNQLVGDVWTIPITKNGRAHTLPLPPLALALATAGWPRRDYGSLHAFLVARKTGWFPHDLRRSAATRMRDAGVPADAIEAILNHAPPRLVRTYQRPNMLPPMRRALEALEAHVLAVVRETVAK